MSLRNSTHNPLSYRPAALIALTIASITAGLTIIVAPEYWSLASYGLYAIPSHLLISFLPHEPALFYAAKLYLPVTVALVGTIACIVAILFDYWLIGWFVNHKFVLSKIENSHWFLLAQRWFKKAPFLLIIGSALAPVPFYPVKILAIVSEYSIVRFIIALVIGRFPRFWLLAIGGQQVNASNSSLIWVAVGLAAFSAYRIWKVRKNRVPAIQKDRYELKTKEPAN